MLGHWTLEFFLLGNASPGNATKNPKERYILQGQRMAWEKAHEIRIMMLLEATCSISGKNMVEMGNCFRIVFICCVFFQKLDDFFSLKTQCYQQTDEEKLGYRIYLSKI